MRLLTGLHPHSLFRSLPGEEGLGALNLYSRQPSAFNDEIASRASTFAAHAAIMLANAQVYWDARQLNENLSQATRSRATIDQAVGILMAHGGRSPDEAFQLLVRASQRENRKLRGSPPRSSSGLSSARPAGR